MLDKKFEVPERQGMDGVTGRRVEVHYHRNQP